MLGSAALFFALRESDVAERDRLCGTPDCTAMNERQAQVLDDQARTWNTLTNVALVGGATAVVGGVTWWLLARPAQRATTRAWVAPRGDGVALGLQSTF